MEVSLLVKVIASLTLVGAFSLLLILYKRVLKTEKLRQKLLAQGIKGPVPSFFYGNLHEMQRIQMKAATLSPKHSDIIAHDYTSAVFPYFEQWRKEYGPIYTYSTGMKQHLYVNQPDLVIDLSNTFTLNLGKPSYLTKKLAPMLGNGILRSNGHIWAQQRKTIGPEFFMERVKGMVGLMVNSALPLVKKWEACIEAQGGLTADIKVDEDLRGFSADVISRACFGSSYAKGKEIFLKLRTLQRHLSKEGFLFSFKISEFLSLNSRRMITNLEKEIETLIWETVRERQVLCSEKSSVEKDLLQLILEAAVNNQELDEDSTKRFIADNCKNIYFAGHETTAVTTSWCLMLLALHPEWQVRVREEVTRVFKDGLPNADSLSQLKTVTMVIQETLRLYSPGVFVSREAYEEIKIGNLVVPKGVCLWTLIPTVHRDPEVWGSDANEFKPERFIDGVSKACKLPQAYIPFGVGRRVCVGKNFAMVELKIVLSLLVSRFSFKLSTRYRHAPTFSMILEPGNGMHLLIQRISNGKEH